VAAIGVSGKPLPSVTERVAEVERIVGKIEQRPADIDSGRSALEQNRVIPEAVAAALNEWDPATGGWQVMYPAEQMRLLRLLVERAKTSGNVEGSGVRISLRIHPARAAPRVA